MSQSLIVRIIECEEEHLNQNDKLMYSQPFSMATQNYIIHMVTANVSYL